MTSGTKTSGPPIMVMAARKTSTNGSSKKTSASGLMKKSRTASISRKRAT